MFLCCQFGPLRPFRFCLGEGQGLSCPLPWTPLPAPQPGNSGHQVPCTEPSSQPIFPGPQSGSALPGTAFRLLQSRLVGQDSVSPPLPWGLLQAPLTPPLPRAGRVDLFSLVKGAGVCCSGPQNPAALGSPAAVGYFPHCPKFQPLTSALAALEALGLGAPSSVWGPRQYPAVPYKYVYVYIDF